MNNRTITITLTEEFINITANHKKETDTAIGFFCMWAIHNERYKNLFIYGDKHGDINASYRSEQGELTYGMFGQRREDGSYSVNS